MVSGSRLAGLDETTIDQQFGDLDGVECCTLAQIVRNDPDVEAVFDRCILADTRNIGRVLTGRFNRRDVAAILVLVDDEATRRFAQDIARLIGGDLVFELDVDRFRMADEDGNAHGRAGHLDLRIEHLLGFSQNLPLFLGITVFHEDIDMRNDVEGDTLGELLGFDRIGHEDGAGLLEQLVMPSLPAPETD